MTTRSLTVVLCLVLSGFALPRANAAPTLVSQPTSISVALGDSATLTVSAVGTSPVTYQWFQFGAAVPGATNATFQIASTAATDAGAYSVVVTDPTGSVQSSEADIGIRTSSGNVTTDINFENFPLGGGMLQPAFWTFYSGSALVAALPNDALSGVAWEDPWIHQGQSGYIGGEWTNSSLTSASGNLDVSMYPAGPDTIVSLFGSPNPIVQFDLDFSIGRGTGTNDENFIFRIYDAGSAQGGSTFSYHSEVSVAPNDEVYIQDNSNAAPLDTGVSLYSGDPYHIYITVNYSTQTWTAVLEDTQRQIVSLLALNRPINTSGYVLSGYTTVYDGWANVEMNAATVSATNFHFGDTMVFDNYTVTQLAPPSQIPLIDPLSTATNWLFDTPSTPGSFTFQNNHLSKVLSVPGDFRAAFSPGANGAFISTNDPHHTAAVGSAAADWTTQVALHVDTLAGGNTSWQYYAALEVYNLQDAEYDDELFITFGQFGDGGPKVISAFNSASTIGYGATVAQSDILVRASYASATHQLSALYSVDGGVNWLPLLSFDVTQPPSGGGWSMTPTSSESFGFVLEGLSDSNSVTTADSLYFSNYSFTGLFPGVWPQYNSGPAAATILTQPISIVEKPGETVSFSVLATGSPAPAYTWTMNGHVLSDGTQPDGSGAVGTSSGTLVLYNIQPGENQAVFMASVSNALGSATSSAAVLYTDGTAFTIDPLSSNANWAYDPNETTSNASLVFENGRLDYIVANPSPTETAQDIPSIGANGGAFSPSDVVLVGSAAADWTTQVKVHADTLVLTGQQQLQGSMFVYDLQDTHFDNGMLVSLTEAPNQASPGLQVGSWGNSVSTSVAGVPSDVILRAHYASATHVLMTSYSTDNGLSWSPLVAFDVTLSNANGGWGMTGAAGASFGITLVGNSSGGTLNGPVISAGNLSFTNFAYDGLQSGHWPVYTPPPTPPNITGQPLSETVNKGSPAAFTVTATGTAPLTYQWNLNGVAINGATKATYKIGSASVAKAGIYTVVVTNSVGSTTSADATLAVNVAPAFTTQPTSQTVDAGSTATFTVAASGFPAPTFQWSFAGAAIPGATGPTLSLQNVQPTAAGAYTVTASNSQGSVTSKTAKLTVDFAPVFLTQPSSQIVVAGTNVTLSVTASGTPTPKFKWSLNGVPISGGTNGTLNINNIKATNAGTYTAAATNSVGTTVSDPATITVNVPPTIATQPKSQSVKVGANVTFSVVASGSPTLTYQWTFDGANMSGAISPILTLSNVQTSATGNYSVTVANTAGVATSKTVTLNVK